jgi:hypothetical protein
MQGENMQPTITDWIQASAAVVTMLAAALAVYIAAKAPRWAAEFADRYRRDSESAEERERIRRHVMMMLVKGRSQIIHPDTVSAINTVDVAFFDVPAVRSAHRVFFNTSLANDPEATVRAYHDLVNAVVAANGMGDHITPADMQMGYYPAGWGKLDEAALADAETKIAKRARSTSEKQAR